MLGDDFKDNIGQMVKDNIDTLCNHPEDFVTKLIDLMKEKVTTKMKESSFIPSFVRIAMEKSLGMLNSQKGTLSMPLKAAMMAPPMLAACKAGDNTLVSEGIQKTIDAAFAKICGDSHVEEEPNNKKNNTKNNTKNNKNKNNSSKNNTAKNTKNNTAANAKTNDPKEVVANNAKNNDSKEVVANNAKTNDPKEVVANNAKTNDPKEVVANNAKTNDPKEVVANNAKTNDPKEVVANNAKTNDPKGNDSKEDPEGKVVEELKGPIEEVTPKLKEIIDNQEKFKNENDSENKKNIKEEFEQTKKDAVALQEKINNIMTEKGGDLIFTDLIKKHFKEYSEHLDKLGLLDTGDDDKSEGEGEGEGESEETKTKPEAEETKPEAEETKSEPEETIPEQEETKPAEETKPTEETQPAEETQPEPEETQPATENIKPEETEQKGGKKRRTRRSSRKLKRKTSRKH